VNAVNGFLRAIMRSPIVWGLLACGAFYGLIFGGPLDLPILHRYFANHPVEYGETLLFSIGMAATLLRLADIAAQRLALVKSPWDGIDPNQLPFDEHCQTLLAALDSQPKQRHDDYYFARLRAALQHVIRAGSSQQLDDELKYLSDCDATLAHGRYGLFRLIVWAIPILGFLGTVIGITLALNHVDPKHLDTSMAEVMQGLGLKFDTTAVALSLSIVLMFVHFFVADQRETALLRAVDRKVERELAEYLPSSPAGADGQIAATRRMAEVMVAATERLIERQAQLWQASIEAAAARWSGMADASAETLTRALDASLQQHAQRLAANEESIADQGRRQWEKIAQGQLQHVQSLAAVQNSITQQTESMERIVQATHEVEKLEDALNRNLAALAGAKNFEQTVLGLAAAIHLLNGRLAESATSPVAVQLDSKRRNAKAA
jgi:biopolymer transport protein ExbB/TolQ